MIYLLNKPLRVVSSMTLSARGNGATKWTSNYKREERVNGGQMQRPRAQDNKQRPRRLLPCDNDASLSLLLLHLPSIHAKNTRSPYIYACICRVRSKKYFDIFFLFWLIMWFLLNNFKQSNISYKYFLTWMIVQIINYLN